MALQVRIINTQKIAILLANFEYLIAVNSGHDNGAIRYLELMLERPLQWCICLLHFNELIFKRLISLYVGQTKGPSKRQSELDYEIRNVANNIEKVTQFRRIVGNLHEEIDDVLLNNNDQKYLFTLYCGITARNGRKILLEKFGEVPPPPPGAIHEARWLTYANAAMRLYVQTENPTDDFSRLIYIIVYFYVPMFFQIKKYSNIAYGTRHYFRALFLVSKLDEEEKRAAHPGFITNSFMCHSESVLLTGIMDPRIPIRQKYLQLVLRAKRKQESRDEMRKYIKPSTVNFDAKSYHDLLDKENLSVPPVLKPYDIKALQKHASGEAEIIIPNILCHSTNTERAVQNTAFAGDFAIGQDGRERFLLNLQKSRKDFDKNAKKIDFVSL